MESKLKPIHETTTAKPYTDTAGAPPLLRAKASTQTLQDWHGDTSAFVFKDGVLSIAEGAAGSSAMIYRGFSDLGDVYSFSITTLMDKPPTSRNTFKWEVLSLRSNGGEYGLYVAPTAQGQGVGLYQELPSGTDRLLTSLVLPDRLSDWQRLKILVERDKTKYRLRIITPTGRAIKGDWLTLPVEGDVIRRMIFTAKFTKNARSHLHWRLPTVSEGLEGVPDDEVHVDVQILSIKPDFGKSNPHPRQSRGHLRSRSLLRRTQSYTALASAG